MSDEIQLPSDTGQEDEDLDSWSQNVADPPNLINDDENIQYYMAIMRFKRRFVKNLEYHCDKRREIYKIWAHWLIRILSRRKINYHPLTKLDSETLDEDIIKHMEQNKVSRSRAVETYRDLVDQYNKMHTIFAYNHEKLLGLYEMRLCTDSKMRNSDVHAELQGKERLLDLQSKVNFSFFTGGSIYILGLEGTNLSIKLTPDKFFKLQKMYRGPPDLFLLYLFEYSFNYYLLDGKSLQWSIPGEVFEELRKFNLRGELFASPVNHYCSKFYSLFEVDKLFSSQGNFFSLENDDQLLPSGLYEVNPPFIEEIFTESTKLIVKLLERSTVPLGFIYIMPGWVDLHGYNFLTGSKFFAGGTILERNKHFYFQCSNNKYILACFDTNILIVANKSFKKVNNINKMLANVKHAFAKDMNLSRLEALK